MILLLAVTGFWFSQLSGIPQTILIEYSDRMPLILKRIVSALECTRCVCFWLGVMWGHSVFTCLLFGALCSFIGITISKLYKWI